MELKKLNVRVGDNTYIDVEYRCAVLGEKVNIEVRYENGQWEMAASSPMHFDDETILEIVRDAAKLHYLGTD